MNLGKREQEILDLLPCKAADLVPHFTSPSVVYTAVGRLRRKGLIKTGADKTLYPKTSPASAPPRSSNLDQLIQAASELASENAAMRELLREFYNRIGEYLNE